MGEAGTPTPTMRHVTLEVVLEDRTRTPPPPPPASRALARTHTLRELRALCTTHGLPISGSKHELAARVAPALGEEDVKDMCR